MTDMCAEAASNMSQNICYYDEITDMNGKFLFPLTGLNDFDILGAAPMIREK